MMARGQTWRSPKRIWVDLLLYPAHTLPTAAAPVLVGAGLAIHDRVFVALPTLMAFLGSWLIHVAGVFVDNHELLRRHPCVVEHPDLSMALEDRSLTLNQVKLAIGACLFLALPTALFFLKVGGPATIAVGALGLVASLGYAGGPLPYAKLGLAEVVFFAMFGIVAVAGTYFVQVAWLRAAASPALSSFASPPLSAFVVGLPIGALVTNVLIIDDLRDRHFDALKGWRTTAVRFGAKGSRMAFLSLSIFAYVAPFAFWAAPGFGAWVLMPLLTSTWAWSIARTVWTHDEQSALAPMTANASLLSLTYAALLALGLALG
ncbi:MAG TPA: UbiA family prenyltransferase [Casimicrobiaceae bacterium]|nr:UbiA family prenyltransferase [Casimicrobiaceae bacterium]